MSIEQSRRWRDYIDAVIFLRIKFPEPEGNLGAYYNSNEYKIYQDTWEAIQEHL
jgi:hypothetical protein